MATSETEASRIGIDHPTVVPRDAASEEQCGAEDDRDDEE